MPHTHGKSPSPEHTETPALASQRTPGAASRVLLPAITVAVLCLLVRLPFLGAPGFDADQFQNIFWSERAHAEGIDWLYTLRPDGSGKYWCNYPPAYVYVLEALASGFNALAPEGTSLDGSVIMALAKHQMSPATELAVWLYKIPAVIADVLLVSLLTIWLSTRYRPWLAAIPTGLYALAPAVIHNSAIWGQMDAVPTLLMVASLEMARRKKILWMVAFATVASLTKAQACVLAPLWAVIAIQWMGTDTRRWTAAMCIAAGIIAVVLLPLAGSLDGVWSAYADAAGYYPFTHLNGFSVWFLGTPLLEPQLGNLASTYARDDVPLFLGLSARTLGLIGVLTIWASVAIVLWRRRCSDKSLEWATRILPLAFFVMATQMHERYLFPAIALWAWAYVPSARWWLGWLLIILCVTLNEVWAWVGPANASWTTWCEKALHQPWLGTTPGSWCAMLLVVVLLLAFLGWFGKWSPLRRNSHADAGTSSSD